MRSIQVSTAFAALTFCLTGSAFGVDIKPDPVSGKIDWIYDYEDGQAAALKTGKPIFVVFRCER